MPLIIFACMKQILTLAILLISAQLTAQTIAKDETDKFTKHHLVQTSWEPVRMNGFDKLQFRLSKIDTNLFLQLRLVQPSPYAAGPEDKVYLRLENDSVAVLNIDKYGMPNNMSGYWMAEYAYAIKPDAANLLSSAPLKDVRLTLTGGYIDYEIKKRNQSRLQEALKLLNY